MPTVVKMATRDEPINSALMKVSLMLRARNFGWIRDQAQTPEPSATTRTAMLRMNEAVRSIARYSFAVWKTTGETSDPSATPTSASRARTSVTSARMSARSFSETSPLAMIWVSPSAIRRTSNMTRLLAPPSGTALCGILPLMLLSISAGCRNSQAPSRNRAGTATNRATDWP